VPEAPIAPDPPPSRPAVARATGWILLSAACFGSNSSLTLVATGGGAALLTILFWRYLLAAPVLVLAAGGPRRLAAVPRRRLLAIVLFGGGGQGLVTILSLSSLRYISVATLAFLFYTYPAWVALFSVLRGRERLDARRLAALALSLLGVGLMLGGPGPGTFQPLGVALALGAAIVYGLFIPVIDRLQTGVSPETAAVGIASGAALLFAVAAVATGTLTAGLAPRAWAATVALALIGTVLAFVSFLKGLPTLGPVRAAIVSTVEPFWTALLGLLVLGQPLTAGTLAGGALIASAVVLLHLPGRERERK
jgi:drug/metabolite transporter (DMT)-like permease